MACSDKAFVYNHSLDTLFFSPEIIISPNSLVESIQQAKFPQLIFSFFYKEILADHTSFFTDASKKDDFSYVGYAFYSPSRFPSI